MQRVHNAITNDVYKLRGPVRTMQQAVQPAVQTCRLHRRPQRKRRQKRTVFSGYQKLELEKAFEMSHYPSQIHLKTLAMYLNLKIETVKV